MNALGRAAALLVGALAVAGLFSAASAQEAADSAEVDVDQIFVGERATLRLVVVAPAGATVEVDPAAPSWNGVEVVSIRPLTPEPAGENAVYRFTVVIAPFLPGDGAFEPSVTILTPDGATIRTLPAVAWTVRSTLAEDAPLELRPLALPSSISGAESPLLRPAIALGAVVAALVLVSAIVVLIRFVAGRRPAPEAEVMEGPPLPVGFEAVETLIDHDPVSAYRALANIVRGVIGSRYGVPATALTTTELRNRMETSGADRFQARLVGGFLEECDSVVYAGYRPAAERRRADLTMAREIVEASAS